MSDILIDNKNVYNFELKFLSIFSIFKKIIILLFLIGFFENKPKIFLELNFVVKLILGIFLVYRFNKYRNNPIKFTELDRKICSSAGSYIIFIAFADYINAFMDEIREHIIKFTGPFVTNIKSKLKEYTNTFYIGE
jgi:ABC-type multidrug transport system fused ATPase/permease subunit